MAIAPGKLQTQSSAHALVIRPDTAPAKYLPRLLIYAVIALAYFLAGVLLLLYFDRLKQHFLSIFCVTAILFLIDQWFTRDAFDVFWIAGFGLVFGFWRYFGNFSKYGEMIIKLAQA